MTKVMYHATEYKNLESILVKGIHRGIDGVVYLCDKPEDALKFLAIRLIQDIVVFTVSVDESKIEESFDHNQNFFKCKAYMVAEDIPSSAIIMNNIMRYEL